MKWVITNILKIDIAGIAPMGSTYGPSAIEVPTGSDQANHLK
jgi:hypothetical protein